MYNTLYDLGTGNRYRELSCHLVKGRFLALGRCPGEKPANHGLKPPDGRLKFMPQVKSAAPSLRQTRTFPRTGYVHQTRAPQKKSEGQRERQGIIERVQTREGRRFKPGI